MTYKHIFLFVAIAFLFTSAACKKKKVDPHVPPDVRLKTDAPYTSTDKSLNKKDTILVGIVVTKTEDDLKSYNVSYFYDGIATGTTYYNYFMADNEKTGYEKDIKISTRNQAGTEKWVFTIIDRDGNMTQKTITLNVQ